MLLPSHMYIYAVQMKQRKPHLNRNCVLIIAHHDNNVKYLSF